MFGRNIGLVYVFAVSFEVSLDHAYFLHFDIPSLSLKAIPFLVGILAVEK